MDAVVVIDHRGRVVFWNPAAEAMFGHTQQQAEGRDIAELIIPPELRGQHHQALAASRLGRRGGILGRRVEVVGQRADGARFPVELTITRTELDGRLLFTGYLRDITERQRLLDDLRVSRARLVAVSDETRRQIERNLHDGAQQQLVGLAMLVGQARAHLGEDQSTTHALLVQTSDVIADTIGEIRELARGVLPAALAEHGVPPALAELGRRSPIPVKVAIHGPKDARADGGSDQPFGRWTPTVETTLYFVVAEGLTNAAKHGARSAQVQLSVTLADPVRIGIGDEAWSGWIECRVSDDGPGGVDESQGTGLVGLRDRVAAVGGTLHVESPPGAGTTLWARIPATRR